jgi:hypothetical protein
MKKVRVFVNYCTVDFEIKGYYLQGDSYDNTKSCIDDAEILIQGVDMWEILSTKQWNDILDLAIKEIED